MLSYDEVIKVFDRPLEGGCVAGCGGDLHLILFYRTEAWRGRRLQSAESCVSLAKNQSFQHVAFPQSCATRAARLIKVLNENVSQTHTATRRHQSFAPPVSVRRSNVN